MSTDAKAPWLPSHAPEASTWRGAGATCTISTRTVCHLGLRRGACEKAPARYRTAGRHGRATAAGGRPAERSPGMPDRCRRGARRAAKAAPCSTRGSDAALGASAYCAGDPDGRWTCFRGVWFRESGETTAKPTTQKTSGGNRAKSEGCFPRLVTANENTHQSTPRKAAGRIGGFFGWTGRVPYGKIEILEPLRLSMASMYFYSPRSQLFNGVLIIEKDDRGAEFEIFLFWNPMTQSRS